ncbi:hypothetical protein L1787_17180 [Acuticoccus sp. M5D2P5]|uniref:hypothetical protein n=1 Tax=Acuticoccus kalidii TaxID=2910977 RepID=UPI001F3C4F04|nr:hypothetical protein [Acuticoccus kalidii]MCF3935134.1 hypothetical protein [Acuticoccus kalidii]
MVRLVLNCLALIATIAPLAAMPFDGARVPFPSPAPSTGLVEIHGCHSNPFFDENGKLHRHDRETCELKPIEPMLGVDICSTVAQLCVERCEERDRPMRCLRRCYRYNAPPVC